jgi:hypothetical protein
MAALENKDSSFHGKLVEDFDIELSAHAVQVGSEQDDHNEPPAFTQEDGSVIAYFVNFNGYLRIQKGNSELKVAVDVEDLDEEPDEFAAEVFSSMEDDKKKSVEITEENSTIRVSDLDNQAEKPSNLFDSEIVAPFDESKTVENLQENSLGVIIFASPLHQKCASSSITLEELEKTLENNPESVSIPDDNGQLPLHILGNNSDLVVDHPMVATAFGRCLMQIYPEAVIRKDILGRMPFTETIQKWVEWTHISQGERKQIPNTSSMGWKQLVPAFRSELSLLDGTDANESNESSKKFPPAEITDNVEWCFAMLSTAMDNFGGKTASGTNRPVLSYSKQLEDRAALAANLNSIPLIFKTIFLLESNACRKHLLETSILRRAILCPGSIGPWLTQMLRRPPIFSRLAIDYFEVVSSATISDFIGDFRKPQPDDMEKFHKGRRIIYDAIEELGDIIPSLVVLDKLEIDRSADTRVVWYVMSRNLIKPFVVGLVITDVAIQVRLTSKGIRVSYCSSLTVFPISVHSFVGLSN